MKKTASNAPVGIATTDLFLFLNVLVRPRPRIVWLIEKSPHFRASRCSLKACSRKFISLIGVPGLADIAGVVVSPTRQNHHG